MSGGNIMAILSPLKVTNQFVSPKSMNIRESIATVTYVNQPLFSAVMLDDEQDNDNSY